MKYLVIALIVMLSLVSPAIAQTPTATPGSATAYPTTAVVTAESLNVRSGPGADYEAVGHVNKGDVVYVAGRNQAGDWLNIAKDDIVGWASARYLDTLVDVSTLPVVSSEPAPQQTVTPVATSAATSGAALQVDPRDLAKDPQKYMGEFIVLTGRVFNIWEISGLTQFLMWARGGSQDVNVAVSYEGSLPGVYEGTSVKVWGMGLGSVSGTPPTGEPFAHAPLVVASEVEILK